MSDESELKPLDAAPTQEAVVMPSEDDPPEVLTAASFRRAARRPILRAVDIEGWGWLYLRVVTGKERGLLMGAGRDASADAAGKTSRLQALVVAVCACDEEGVRLFDDKDAAWIETEVPVTILDAVMKEALALNGLAPESIEDAEKN